MEEKKERAQIAYAVAKHHRQLLRTQIAPETINQLDINDQPSKKYKQAYQSLFYDEAEKTLFHQRQKKQKQQLQQKQNNQAYVGYGIRINQLSQSNLALKNNSSDVYTKGLKNKVQTQYRDYYGSCQKSYVGSPNKYNGEGKQFRDYDLEKRAKAQYLINKGVSKGLKLHQEHQKYERGKMWQAISTENILKQQIGWKQYSKKMQQQQKNQQNSYYQALHQKMKQQQELKKIHLNENRDKLRNDIRVQMQEQRQRKQKKSIFLYNNLNRHNPITNPIQYHIDNPYILKKIQDQKRNLNKN